MSRMHKGRIRAAKALASTFNAHRNEDGLADKLLQTYMNTGKGDEHDIQATIVDAVSDLGYRMRNDGGDFAQVVHEVRSRHVPTTLEAEIIKALEPAYQPHRKGYDAKRTFDDIVRVAGDHNQVEPVAAGIPRA